MCNQIREEKARTGNLFVIADKVRTICRNVSVTDLNKDDHLDILKNNLEKLYVNYYRHQLILLGKNLSHFKDPLKPNSLI